jgi:hypothetical protein
MTTQQLEERSQRLEARVAILEAELIQMKQMLLSSVQTESPWWLKVTGSFEHDPTFTINAYVKPMEQFLEDVYMKKLIHSSLGYLNPHELEQQ